MVLFESVPILERRFAEQHCFVQSFDLIERPILDITVDYVHWCNLPVGE